MYKYNYGLGSIWVGETPPPTPSHNIIWMRIQRVDGKKGYHELMTWNVHENVWQHLSMTWFESNAATVQWVKDKINEHNESVDSHIDIRVAINKEIEERKEVDRILEENITNLSSNIEILNSLGSSLVTGIVNPISVDPTQGILSIQTLVKDSENRFSPNTSTVHFPGVTESAAGFMAAIDKKKLNGISGGIQDISIPNKDFPSTLPLSVSKKIWQSNNWTSLLDELILPSATQVRAGVLTAADKVKIDNIAKDIATALQTSKEFTTQSIGDHNTSNISHTDIRNTLNTCIGLPIWDSKAYSLTFTTQEGSKLVVDLPLEEMHLRYNEETKAIEFDNGDGSISSIPIADFITEYIGYNGTEITTTVEGSVIKASLVNNSIQWDKLHSDLQTKINNKADITYVDNSSKPAQILQSIDTTILTEILSTSPSDTSIVINLSKRSRGNNTSNFTESTSAITLPAATTTTAGLLTAADKVKLNNIDSVIEGSLALGEDPGTAYEGSKGKLNRSILDSLGSRLLVGNINVVPSDTIVTTNLDYLTRSDLSGLFTKVAGSFSIPAATTTTAGVMTAADKTKLNSAVTGGPYLPLAGGVMTGSIVLGKDLYLKYSRASGGTSMVYYDGARTVLGGVGSGTTRPTLLRSRTNPQVDIRAGSNPGIFTIWHTGNLNKATTSSDGLLSKEDKSILDSGIWEVQVQTIDATTLDPNTYYPVTFTIGSSITKISTFEVYSSLGDARVPWGSYQISDGKGSYSVYVRWTDAPDGWGSLYSEWLRTIEAKQYRYTETCPIQQIGQMIAHSRCYFYVRGGGKYYLRSTGVSPQISTCVIHTEPFTEESTTIAPTTTQSNMPEGLRSLQTSYSYTGDNTGDLIIYPGSDIRVGSWSTAETRSITCRIGTNYRYPYSSDAIILAPTQNLGTIQWKSGKGVSSLVVSEDVEDPSINITSNPKNTFICYTIHFQPVTVFSVTEKQEFNAIINATSYRVLPFVGE